MIKYPKMIKKEIKQDVKLYKVDTSKNRGIGFEREVELTNLYYKNNNIAFIYKKPTPIQIVKVDYSKREKTKITEAYFSKPSTTDYNGIYDGMYIDFDVKETINKTSIPINNILNHQIEHLKNIYENGGIAFLIIYFKMLDRYFILPYKDLAEFIKQNDRKSIPVDYFINSNLEVKFSFKPRLDYLLVIKNNLDRFLKSDK